MSMNNNDEQRLALFIDFENIAIGVRDAHHKKFEIHLVLERLLEKGKILVKRAYSDWTRYAEYRRKFHESAIELIEVPQKSIGGKNSADIRMVVDAMDMASQKEHINCFVIVSGDSDFSPLVSKLKENGKHVIGLGVKNSTSDLLVENCDEFIFYEDLVRGQASSLPKMADLSAKLQECFALMVDSILALRRENKEILWGSMVKQTMQRKKPSFNEEYYGFRTFSALLEDAEKRGIIRLKKDQKSGSYLIVAFGEKETFGAREALKAKAPVAEPKAEKAPEKAKEKPVEKPAEKDDEKDADDEKDEGEGGTGKRRRRRRGGRGRGKKKEDATATSESEDAEETGLEEETDTEDDLDEDDSPYGEAWAAIPTEPDEPETRWSESPAPADEDGEDEEWS